MAARRVEPGGWVALLILGGVWAWWAVKEGAYFGAVLYPGIVVLAAGFVLVTTRTGWATRLALPGSARLAIGALLVLAGWSALSAFWSPAPDIAVADAQRIAGYALAFTLGAWLVALVRDRVHLALVPLAFGALAGGVAALIALFSSDDFARLLDEGTLQYPIGYRNANAAFFLIAMWPALTLAATRELRWPLRALALGTATLAIELAVLSQSRGSMVAVVAALAVYFLVTRARARAVGWLLLAVVPAMVVVPEMVDLYQAADDDALGTAELRAAGRAALGGMLLATALGAAAAVAGRRLQTSEQRSRRADRVSAAGVVAALVAGLTAFAVATGDPAGWVGDRFDEFLTQRSPGTEGASRFGANAGSERDDLWRVSLELAGDEPVAGIGGGGFQYEYPLRRSEDGIEAVRDAHSVELEVLAELGVVGLVLLAVALGAIGVGAWRSRRSSPEHAALAACALTGGAYWLAHSSLDWFWTYPVVTAPVLALLGSACGALARREDAQGRGRGLAALAAALLAISVVPPYLAERYVESGYANWRGDPERSENDLDLSRTLNPLSVEPLIAEAAIARADHRTDDAIAGFEEVLDKRPEEWVAHYFLADLTKRSDPERAQAELEAAAALNPLGFQIEKLSEELRATRAK